MVMQTLAFSFEGQSRAVMSNPGSSRRTGGKTMARFDYDVVIIGSGFGGSVAALRAARRAIGWVMEAGKRWKDERNSEDELGLEGLCVVSGS